MNTFLGNEQLQNHNLTLTPKMIQELKILQMSNADLLQYIDEQLIENPILEADDEVDAVDGVLENNENENESEYEYDNDNIRTVPENMDFTKYTSKPITLRHYLVAQLGERRIPLAYRRLALYLIECIDDDGYITFNLNAISQQLNVPLKVIKAALKIVHDLEPDGVGARNLKECLLIQLHKKGVLDENIKRIITNHLELLAERKYKEVSQLTGLSKEMVIDIHNSIKKLNAKPGQAFNGGGENKYIIPELAVKEINRNFTVTFISGSISNVRICDTYKKMIFDEQSNKETNRFIREKLSKGRELINAIEQRERTILNVADCIMEYQTEFLKHGYKYLKPMTMKMVADMVGLHESTVSRTVNQKYIQTPWGTHELKFFFSSGLDAEDTADISANAIKRFVKRIVQNEDKKNPLSDEMIKRLLADDGIHVARRTITKYRCELNIPSAKLRSVL